MAIAKSRACAYIDWWTAETLAPSGQHMKKLAVPYCASMPASFHFLRSLSSKPAWLDEILSNVVPHTGHFVAHSF
jgi:hypothetical protein